jgi:hypothetical protein
MVVKAPPARHKIDGRTRVLDQCLVLDEDGNRVTALLRLGREEAEKYGAEIRHLLCANIASAPDSSA